MKAATGCAADDQNPCAQAAGRSSTPRRRVCQLCFRIKEKCISEPGQPTCRRCSRLGKTCVPRQIKRLGRQPTIKPVKYGSYSVIDVGYTTAAPNDAGDDSNADPAAKDEEHTTSTDVARRKRSPRDTSMQDECLVDQLQSLAAIQSALAYSLVTLEPSGYRWHLTEVLKSSEGFFVAHSQFMLGRSFVHGFQNIVNFLFRRSPELMTDAYSAVLKLMEQRTRPVKEREIPDLAIGTRCLKSLRQAIESVRQVEDAMTVIMLGQILTVYNGLVSCPSAHLIVRNTLLSVKDWYPLLLQQPEMDCVTLAPVLLDTVESLIRREMPIVRMPETDRHIVDRFIGVCASLLTLLYDLCKISYQLKDTGYSAPSSQWNAKQVDPYTEIEGRIRAWIPNLPQEQFALYTTKEVTLMLAQARIYRTASLLIIHRLRFPLGTEDLVAQVHAESILNELELLLTWPTPEPFGFGIDFPIIPAIVELPERGEEVLRAFAPLKLRQAPTEEILEYVRYVRKAYEMGYDGSWLDLVQGQLLGVILP